MNFKNLNKVIIAIILTLTLFFSAGLETHSFADTKTTLYETAQNTIYDNIKNIASFILIPIGVLMIIINIIIILWALIAGEQGKVGGKVGAIMVGFLLVIVGVGVSNTRNDIFQKPSFNTNVASTKNLLTNNI
jgi:NADH:ubiquinone oxidoreductase subunit 3 (subunit A)